jgi:hypothetical protein
MIGLAESTPFINGSSLGASHQNQPAGMTCIAVLCEAEVENRVAEIRSLRQAEIRQMRQEDRLKHFEESLVQSWPIAAGLVLACFAPGLRDLATLFHPWGMRLLFPLVELAGRQEIHLGGELARTLPQAMLYIQFPLEGLLARHALKDRSTLSGVAMRLFIFHFLAAVDLWLLCRGALG